jgi:hypothetical protein
VGGVDDATGARREVGAAAGGDDAAGVVDDLSAGSEARIAAARIGYL